MSPTNVIIAVQYAPPAQVLSITVSDVQEQPQYRMVPVSKFVQHLKLNTMEYVLPAAQYVIHVLLTTIIVPVVITSMELYLICMVLPALLNVLNYIINHWLMVNVFFALL